MPSIFHLPNSEHSLFLNLMGQDGGLNSSHHTHMAVDGKEEDVFLPFRIHIISINSSWPELNHLIMWPNLSAGKTSAGKVSMCLVKNWILYYKARQGEWMKSSLFSAKTCHKIGHWFHCQGPKVLQGPSNPHNSSLVILRIPLTSLVLQFFICKGRLSSPWPTEVLC